MRYIVEPRPQLELVALISAIQSFGGVEKEKKRKGFLYSRIVAANADDFTWCLD